LIYFPFSLLVYTALSSSHLVAAIELVHEVDSRKSDCFQTISN
jgi:hypothetical protein